MDEDKKKYRDIMMHYAINIILITWDEKKLSGFIRNENLSPSLKALRDEIETDFLMQKVTTLLSKTNQEQTFSKDT